MIQCIRMNKEEIENTLTNLANKYFPSGVKYKFDGFTYTDNFEIAKTLGLAITYNQKYLNAKDDQIERTLLHELQHAKNWSDIRLNDGWYAEEHYSFVLHPKFRDLYERSKNYYAEKDREGAGLELKFYPLPNTFREVLNTNNNYASPDEFLARLRGFEHYLNQVRNGVDVETLPFESIEAFQEEDLKFLDSKYREDLASELKETNPEIFKIPELQIKKEIETTTEGGSKIEIRGYNIR